ncbi:hypothetical protein VTN00DRAFT_4695 [Thermoascus crustaceus]|uniref:uncharacterized protein n=1 Tax=Thermoascus crustaceus TaxID=5088 RepID=UPI003742BFAE
MPRFAGQQFPQNIGQPLSLPEGFPPLNSPAGFNPYQSNQNFIPPESQLTPSSSYPMSTSVRTPSKQRSLSPSTPYTFNQPPYDIPQASFASPYPGSTTPESRVPTTAAPAPAPVSPHFSPSGSASGSPGPENQVRVISSRPKPQCWDHGCNGREFSTFSNLLRHQRERSGASAKAECPHCGAVFTRTTARNTHIAQGKCKGAGRGSVDTD